MSEGSCIHKWKLTYITNGIIVFIAALGNCDSYSKYCDSTVPSQAHTKELIIFVHIELLHKIHSHVIHNSQMVGPIQKCQLADG